MPGRCWVPLCKGNYPTGPKVSIFSFPKSEELRKNWIAAIQRKDSLPTKYSKVCHLHFRDDDFETETSTFDEKKGILISVPLHIRRLKKTAVPSVFSYPPSSCSSSNGPIRKPPDEKRAERESLRVQKAAEASSKDFELYKSKRQICCAEDLRDCIAAFGVPDFWNVHTVADSETVCFLHIVIDPIPVIICSVKMNSECEVSVYLQQTSIKKVSKFAFPHKVADYNEILEILEEVAKLNKKKSESKAEASCIMQLINDLLESIATEKNENVIKFVQDQLNLLICPKNNFRYSSSMVIFSSLLHSISPHAYRFARQSGNLILPYPSTLQKVCNSLSVSPEQESKDENFFMYIKNRAAYLQEHEKTVILMLDEIHIKQNFEYKGGSIVGAAFDCSSAATSAFVFMISSMLSSFKEVVHILPVRRIDFMTLHRLMRKIIVGLEDIGFRVICVVTDNNAINGKSMSLFSTPPKKSFCYAHPCDPTRPLFFIIDSVHLLKNIRNNWLNQKNHGTCMFYPDFEGGSGFHTASFFALGKLYEIESSQLVKYSYGLTLKSLCPSNLERQNVKLVLKVFNRFVVEGLFALGMEHTIPHHADTANFIKIVIKWWEIMNVKSPQKGIRKRNVFMEPLTNDDGDEKIIFLNDFLDWLDAWKAMNCSTGCFSEETHAALHQTTYGILELHKYCIDECKMQYFLPGKIQTDSLENRFGKYRQLAGSQYHISMKQLLECEKKLRIQSCIKLELLVKAERVKISSLAFPADEMPSSNTCSDCPSLIIESDIGLAKRYLPVLTYLGGYCCHSVLKKLKCQHCQDNLVIDSTVNLDESYSLIKNLDRGGLKCPIPAVVNAVLFNYIVVDKLCSQQKDFFSQNNQREKVADLTFKVLESREMLIDVCDDGHTPERVCKMIVWISTNIILKNLCLRKNDTEKSITQGKKRKLETLKK